MRNSPLPRTRRLLRVASLPLVLAAIGLSGCGSSSSSTDDPPPDTGAGGSAGTAGAAGSAGSAGKAGGAAGTAGKGGSAGTGGTGGTAGTGGAAGTGGSAGVAGAAGTAGVAGKGGAAGVAGAAGTAGAAGVAGSGGVAGTGGTAGTAGVAGQAGKAGAGNECAGMPGVGEVCSTGLKGICGQGHNKCVQGVLSCAPDFPEGKPETCNGEDDDCDGQIDNGLPTKTFYQDNDGDGFGSTATASSCQAPMGYAEKSGDCNDNNKDIHPEAAEICNGIDDNCDGSIDEGAPKTTFFVDSDGDGFGSTATIEACALGPGLADTSSDCNDNNKNIYPGAAEVCNDVDDNCDGSIDEGVSKNTYFVDGDGDGYGSASTVQACTSKPGLTDKPGDCNDTNPDIYPGAIELCNDIDDNCNGAIDEGVQKPTFYKDFDGDGFGGVTAKNACTAPAGYVEDGGDCNDANKNVYPGAPEQCNNLDDDCNGLVDDNVQLLTIYKDNDGDGFAAQNAQSQQKCDVPIGFTVAKDVDGDGKPDWDCDDSQVKVYPGAPEVCGDNLDNSCSGYIDRLCFTKCAGAWPFKSEPNYEGVDIVRTVDLNGDGNQEIIAQDNFGFAILDAKGNPLHQYAMPIHNYSRNTVTVADIDNYDTYNDSVQTLEVLTGNGSYPKFYKLNTDNTVKIFDGTTYIYDASPFMVTDFDRDGQVEFVTTSWCEGNAGTKFFHFNKANGTINLVNTVADGDNTCEYTDGRVLTDLDGDGVQELVFGNGYPVNNSPSTWGGHLFATKLTSLSTLASTPFCAAGSCFATDQAGLFGGGTFDLYRVGDELRAGVIYFTANTPSQPNPSVYKYWRFDLAGNPLAAPSDTDNRFAGTTDINNDGTPEDFGGSVATLGLFDVNGDGFPDRLRTAGDSLVVDLWDNNTKTFANHAPSTLKIATTNTVLQSAWDIDSDGRIEVLSTDTLGNVYCHALGQDTWNRNSSIPPRRPLYLRTNQWDNYEPNEGKDSDGDGLPDEIIRVPSALTAKGDFYSFLSSDTDKDYFQIDASYTAPICLQAPPGKTYTLKVFSFSDKWNNTTQAPGADGKKDGLIWQQTTPAGGKACFSAAALNPQRYAEFKFIIGVESAGGASPFWPYWITATK